MNVNRAKRRGLRTLLQGLVLPLGALIGTAMADPTFATIGRNLEAFVVVTGAVIGNAAVSFLQNLYEDHRGSDLLVSRDE